MCLCMCVFVHVFVHVGVCMWVQVQVCVSVCVCTCVLSCCLPASAQPTSIGHKKIAPLPWVRTLLCATMFVYMRVYVCVRVRACVCTCVCLSARLCALNSHHPLRRGTAACTCMKSGTWHLLSQRTLCIKCVMSSRQVVSLLLLVYRQARHSDNLFWE